MSHGFAVSVGSRIAALENRVSALEDRVAVIEVQLNIPKRVIPWWEIAYPEAYRNRKESNDG